MGVSLISACAVMLAYAVKGLTGFGNTLVFSSIMSFFSSNAQISPIEVILGAPSNIFIALRERRGFKPRVAFPLAALMIIGCVPGALFLKSGDPKLVKILFGVAITAVGAESFAADYLKLRPNKIALAIIGLTAGVMCGMYGIGALLVAYVSRTTSSPAEFRANVCFVFIFVDIFRAALYVATGIFTREIALSALALTPFMVIGLIAGTLLAKKLNAVIVKRAIMALLMLSGISLIITNAI